jgi:hypothetical protein
MILFREANEKDGDPFLSDLVVIFPRHDWVVIEPQYLQFLSEAEHEARQIRLSSGDTAYRLNSLELLSVLQTGSIGFDWTDISGRPRDECTGARSPCYVQCVDGINWYVRTEEPDAVGLLRRHGFVDAELDALPFPEQIV